MSRTRSRFALPICACLAGLLAIGALASCGSSDDSDDAQKLSFTAESKGKAVTFTAPESAELSDMAGDADR